MKTPDQLLQSALLYAGLGWSVFPLRQGDKRPAVKDWPNKATTDAPTIRGWWARWPRANIGLACGDLLAVDLDVRDGRNGIEAWTALQVDADTVTSRTPSGGLHLIYRANGAELGNTAGKLGDGIDTRGAGGYIVLPPSSLGNGAAYHWEVKPTDRTPADLPAELMTLLTKQAREIPIARPTSAPAADADPYARAALEGELDELARTPEGNRNDRLNQAAFSLGQLVGAAALARSEVEAQLLAVATAIGLGVGEAAATIRSGLDAGEQQPRIIPPPTGAARFPPPPVEHGPPEDATPASRAGEPLIDDYNLTDLGNAERLAARYGAHLRYCDPWGQWLAWDGRRWRIDDTRQVDRWAGETVRHMYQAAGDQPNQERREALGKWAYKSESEHRRRAMINGARALLPILPDDLDRDPWLLTCNNGTLDLRTGELRPHRTGDMITKLAPVDYDPEAEAPTWMAFLDRIMRRNQDLIGFLRRAMGYALTGDTREQCLFILYGTGANGKSTFLEAMSELLSDYACKTPAKTVLVKRSDGISEDVARLKGARLVTAAEAEDGQRLAESLVKELTGGDTLAARHLYGRTFEFRPAFKLFLSTNHKPAIRGTDPAIWRRIRLIPFTLTIPQGEQDKTLSKKLRAELPGILAWAVRGCLEWQRAGLGEPTEVQEATAAYKAEQDILGGFLEESCVLEETAQVKAGELYKAYQAWCDGTGERPVSLTRFGIRISERGFDKYKDRRGVWYMGIGLATSEPEPVPV